MLTDCEVNCNVFGDTILNGIGQSQLVPGICSGIQAFFTNRDLANSDTVLTWSPDGFSARRTAACGSQYCLGIQTGLRTFTQDRTLKVSCDEYPFASTEEGGNFLNTLNTNPTNPQLTCVPAWQNSLQGNCNSKPVPSWLQYG